jgi:hypothetical protein
LSAGSAGNSGSNGQLNNITMDAACHIQANTHIISSLGNKVECDYLMANTKVSGQRLPGFSINGNKIIDIAISFLFSLFGYGFLIYFYRGEKDPEKKTFLGLIVLYVGICFVILYPFIASESHLRYFLQLFFVPYLFLGLIFEFIRQKYSKIFVPAVFVVSVLIIGFNFNTLLTEAKLYAANDHSQPQ